jgi:hypothetical protein
MPLGRGYAFLSTEQEVQDAIATIVRDYATLYFHRHPPGDRRTPGGRSRTPLSFSAYNPVELDALRTLLFGIIAEGGQVLQEGPYGNYFSPSTPAAWSVLHRSDERAEAEREMRGAERNITYWFQEAMRHRQVLTALEVGTAPVRIPVTALLEQVSSWDDVIECGQWPDFPDSSLAVYCGTHPFFWVRFLPTVIVHPKDPQLWSLTTQIDIIFNLQGNVPGVGRSVYHPHAFRGGVCWGTAGTALEQALHEDHLVMALEITRRWRIGISGGLLCHVWNPAAFYMLGEKMGRGHLLDCPVWDSTDGTAKALGEVWGGWQSDEEAYIAGRSLHWLGRTDQQREISQCDHNMITALREEYQALSEEPAAWGNARRANDFWVMVESHRMVTFYDPEQAVTLLSAAAPANLLAEAVANGPQLRDSLRIDPEEEEPQYNEDEEDR